MLEEGDSVGLHFPSEQEKDAYIISAVHPAGTQRGSLSLLHFLKIQNLFQKVA